MIQFYALKEFITPFHTIFLGLTASNFAQPAFTGHALKLSQMILVVLGIFCLWSTFTYDMACRTGPSAPAKALSVLSKVEGLLHAFGGLFIHPSMMLAFSNLHSTADKMFSLYSNLLKLLPNQLSAFHQTIAA